MDSGQKVFKGHVGTVSVSERSAEVGFYVTEATFTGIVVDDVPMVRLYTMLVPASEYVATKAEAKQQIVGQLVRLHGVVQAKIDALRDEIMHDLLTENVP